MFALTKLCGNLLTGEQMMLLQPVIYQEAAKGLNALFSNTQKDWEQNAFTAATEAFFRMRGIKH